MRRKFVFICLICLLSLVFLEPAEAADPNTLYLKVKEGTSRIAIKDVHVYVVVLNGGVSHDVYTRQYGDGTYAVLPGLWAGTTYVATLTKAGYDTIRWTFSGAAGYIRGSTPRRCEWTLYMSQQVRLNTIITVVDAISDSLPLSGAFVEIINKDDQVVSSGTTATNGEFVTGLLPSGESFGCKVTKAGYDVLVTSFTVATPCYPPQCDPAIVTGFFTARMNISIVEMPADPITQECCVNTTITVKDSASPFPAIPGATVQLYDTHGNLLPDIPPGTTTDRDGKIALSTITTETYRYVIRRLGYYDVTNSFSGGPADISVPMIRR